MTHTSCKLPIPWVSLTPQSMDSEDIQKRRKRKSRNISGLSGGVGLTMRLTESTVTVRQKQIMESSRNCGRQQFLFACLKGEKHLAQHNPFRGRRRPSLWLPWSARCSNAEAQWPGPAHPSPPSSPGFSTALSDLSLQTQPKEPHKHTHMHTHIRAHCQNSARSFLLPLNPMAINLEKKILVLASDSAQCKMLSVQ